MSIFRLQVLDDPETVNFALGSFCFGSEESVYM